MAFDFNFKKILGSLTSAAKPTSVIGLDIGSSSIKIVQLRLSRGVALLETYGEIALGPYGKQEIGRAQRLPPETIAQAVSDLMREANVTANYAGVSIPFSSSLLTILNLPKVDNEQLKTIVPLEARKYIPIPVSEVTFDWSVIPRDEVDPGPFDNTAEKEPVSAKGQDVLLVAIHNSIMSSYQAITAACNVKAAYYEIEIFSAIRSSLGSGLAPILFVDIGASTTKIYVVERGIVRLTHLLTMGGQQMTETLARSMSWDFEKAERVKRERGLFDSNAYAPDENARIKEGLLITLTRIFSEVNRVLLSYGQRSNKNVSTIIFSGGGASLQGLEEVAKNAISAEAKAADPFSKTESPAFMSDVLSVIGPGFSVSVGLALRALRSE